MGTLPKVSLQVGMGKWPTTPIQNCSKQNPRTPLLHPLRRIPLHLRLTWFCFSHVHQARWQGTYIVGQMPSINTL